MARAIVLDRRDNVATLIDTGSAGGRCALQGEADGAVALAQDVPFGHKVCVRAAAPGDAIVKYGQVIGHASCGIAVGEHVHVHNVESARGRGDRRQD